MSSYNLLTGEANRGDADAAAKSFKVFLKGGETYQVGGRNASSQTISTFSLSHPEPVPPVVSETAPQANRTTFMDFSGAGPSPTIRGRGSLVDCNKGSFSIADGAKPTLEAAPSGKLLINGRQKNIQSQAEYVPPRRSSVIKKSSIEEMMPVTENQPSTSKKQFVSGSVKASEAMPMGGKFVDPRTLAPERKKGLGWGKRHVPGPKAITAQK